MTANGARPLHPLLAGAGALLAAGLLAAPAQAAFPGKNGKIAFEREAFPVRATQSLGYWGDSDLFTMDPDGSAQAPLVADDQGGVGAADPAVSPDGKQVAYVRSGLDEEIGPYSRVHVVGIDGTSDRQAVPGDDHAGAPAWSPDGTRLVYVHEGLRFERSLAQAEQLPFDSLWIANADGSGSPTQLTLDGFEGGDAANPQWSPDGKWIAFDDGRDVYVVPAAGGEVIRVSDFRFSRYPNWAPDGSAIAYERWNESGEIREVPFENGHAGGSALIASGGDLGRPAYSPDGLKLAWSGSPSEATISRSRTLHGLFAYPGIIVANVDGSDPKQVISAGTPLTAPDWAPVPSVKPITQPQGQPPVVSAGPTGAVKGSSDYRCGSRRNFTIRLRPRGAKIVLARVLVNGKRVKVRHPGKRWIARVDLRTLPKKRYTVDVTVWTKSGKRFHEVRRYWTCTPARSR
jgi:TolB protein